jgi:hypothetical protein
MLLPIGLKGLPFPLKELLPFCLVPGTQSEAFGQLPQTAASSKINPYPAQLCKSCGMFTSSVRLLQVVLSLPVFGIPINLKSMVRRLCMATAVAQVMWVIWKHSDLEQETLR